MKKFIWLLILFLNILVYAATEEEYNNCECSTGGREWVEDNTSGYPMNKDYIINKGYIPACPQDSAQEQNICKNYVNKTHIEWKYEDIQVPWSVTTNHMVPACKVTVKGNRWFCRCVNPIERNDPPSSQYDRTSGISFNECYPDMSNKKTFDECKKKNGYIYIPSPGCCMQKVCYLPVCDDNQTLDTNATPPVCIDNPPNCDENQTLDMNATPPVCKDKVPLPECDENQTLDTSYDPPICVPNCDKNQTLDRSVMPPVCKDNLPECTEPDTAFPTLNDLSSVIFFWEEPEDKSSICASQGGSTQQRRISCKNNYRCTCPYTPYPPKANNEEMLFSWSSGTNRSLECSNQGGHVQEAKVACRTDYRCMKKTDTPPKECDVTVGSYVSPRDGVFHEDIEVTGADFGLHYSSATVDDMSIAHGWSISSHARLKNDRVYFGSGSIYVVEPVAQNGYQSVTFGTSELLFDANGTLQSTRDLYTKETKTTFSYDNSGRLVTVTDMYGEITTLKRDANGMVTDIVAPTGQRTLLHIDDNGDLLEVQYEDTSSYAFNYERHLMTKETEPNGNVFLHFFDAHGKVLKVIDAEQGEWLFNSATQSTSGTHTITQASGDVLTYKNHFLTNGILKTEKTLSTGDIILYENSIDDSRSTTTSCGMKTENIYKLNADGTLYKDPYTNRRVLESSTVTTPSGLSKVTHYDKTYTTANGKVASIYTSTDTNNKLFTNLRDYAAFKASTNTAENKTSTIDYDIHNQNIQSMKPYGLLETTYIYDAQGRVIEEHTGERVTHYSYDSRGNLESITNPLNQTTTYSYDDRDRRISSTYADGHVVHYSYDANGNMTVLTTPTPSDHTFAYNGVNKRTDYDSPMGASTHYTYDKQRRITQVTKPSGATIETNYVNGRVESIVTPEGTTNYTYACQSNMSDITKGNERFSFTYDGTLLTRMIQSGMLNQTIDYSYNNDFLPSSMTYAGITTDYHYDKDGRLITSGDFTMRQTLAGTLSSSVTDGTYTQTTHYNGYGEVASQNDSLFGYTVSRNANGQIVEKVETLAGKERHYTYSYDQRGRLIEVNGTATATTGENLLLNPSFESVMADTPEEWRPYGINTTPLADMTQSHTGTYAVQMSNDSAGNSGWVGKEIAIDHQKTLTFGGWSKAQDVSSNALYALDFKVTFEDGTYHWYYADTKFTTGTHDWQHIEVTKTFDKSVVKVRPYALLYRGTGTVWFDDVSVQVGSSVSQGVRNGDFEALSGDVPLGWRSYNNTTPTVDTEQTHAGNYAVKITNTEPVNAGWVGEAFSLNGTHTVTFGGWSKAQDVSSNALYALDFKVTFEDGSYLWYYADTKFATGTHDWQQTEVTKTFDKPVVKVRPYALLYHGTGTVWFDDISVTDEEVQGTGTTSETIESYTYDANGNRESATVHGSTITASYTLDDNLIVYGDNTYAYNDDGYLTEKTTPEGSSTYSYGTMGELREVTTTTSTSSVTITYQHNALNQRVAKLVDGVVVEKYLWADLTTLLAVYDKDDNLIQRFEYADGRMPVAMTQGSTKYYLHYDQVGSLRAISRVLSPDNTTKLVKEITYDTYGNILNDTNPSLKVPFGFAGGLYDSDTKLTRFGYRDYDAYTGKWTAKDPIGFRGGDSNLYGYVLGDPVRGFDPMGLADVNSGFGAGAGFMAGFGGANIHEHVNCSSNGCSLVTTICGRLGLGLHIGGGLEGNAGVDPDGTYGKDCDGDGGDCSYDWSVGLAGEIQVGMAGAGGSTSYGSAGSSTIMDLLGGGIGIGGGVEACLIITCPIHL